MGTICCVLYCAEFVEFGEYFRSKTFLQPFGNEYAFTRQDAVDGVPTEHVDYAMVTTPHTVEGLYALTCHTEHTSFSRMWRQYWCGQWKSLLLNDISILIYVKRQIIAHG